MIGRPTAIQTLQNIFRSPVFTRFTDRPFASFSTQSSRTFNRSAAPIHGTSGSISELLSPNPGKERGRNLRIGVAFSPNPYSEEPQSPAKSYSPQAVRVPSSPMPKRKSSDESSPSPTASAQSSKGSKRDSNKEIAAGGDGGEFQAKRAAPSFIATPVLDVKGSLVVSSWNVNGLRASVRKGFFESLPKKSTSIPSDPFASDVLFLQEVKAVEGDVKDWIGDVKRKGFTVLLNSGLSAGYAGTAVLIKPHVKVLRHAFDASLADLGDSSSESKRRSSIDITVDAASVSSPEDLLKMEKQTWEVNAQEGRVITLELEKCFLVGAYVPNSGQSLERLDFRTKVWEPSFLRYLARLDFIKPVVYTGDLNVAHLNIDCHSPSTNQKTAGFTPQERARFGVMLKAGFIDSYRMLYGNDKPCYTYWGYRFNARVSDKGWRLDYFVISPSLKDCVRQVAIGSELETERIDSERRSDHAPLSITLELV